VSKIREDSKKDGFVVRTTGLAKNFGKSFALENIVLDIQTGGVTAILGANGAGKTTFIHCCLGLTRPSRGDLSMFGNTPGALTTRRRTGVMLQDADLPDLLTAREHIALFSSYYPNPLNADEILDTCKLTDFADKKYKKLSGGQKRRVQFALAIVGNPDLVFLDEPTTGLDTDARRMLWDVVRALADRGRTIILTTHYLEEADALADRIVVMKAGKVIANAPTPEIRELAGGALVKCVSDLSVERIRSYPDVVYVQKSGRFSEINTRNSVTTLRAMLGDDPNISELIVKKPSLEEAFKQLTNSENEGKL